MKHILTILMLFPFVLNAMENEEMPIQRPTRTGVLLSRDLLYYYADIIDNKDTPLPPVGRLESNDPSSRSRQFGDYLVTFSQNTDWVTKIMTAQYTVIKDAVEIARDTVRVEAEKAEVQRYVRPLDNTAYIRMVFWATKQSYDDSFENRRLAPFAQAKIRDNNGIELPRTRASDGLHFGPYFLKALITGFTSAAMRLTGTVTKGAQEIAQYNQEIPCDQMFEQRLDQDATLQVFPFHHTDTPFLYLRDYVDISSANKTVENER
jgi:hypothetical protein